MTVALAQLSDAALAGALVDGDPDALAVMYERFGPELFDTAAGTLRDSDEAADVVQEVFIAAATHIRQLRDRTRLRPWLYSVMRNKTYDRIKARRRAVPHDPASLPEEPIDMPDRADLYDADDLSQLARSAAGGLDVRDQLVLELSERQGLSGRDLADALGVSENQSYTLVHRMRGRARRSVGAYCVARTGRALCEELDRILAGWDGEMTVLLRKRLARHIDRCDQCSETRRKAMPVGLLSSAPAFAAPPELRERILCIDPRACRPSGDVFDADGFPKSPRRYRSVQGGRHLRLGLGAGTVVGFVAVSLMVGSSGTGRDDLTLRADPGPTATRAVFEPADGSAESASAPSTPGAIAPSGVPDVDPVAVAAVDGLAQATVDVTVVAPTVPVASDVSGNGTAAPGTVDDGSAEPTVTLPDSGPARPESVDRMDASVPAPRAPSPDEPSEPEAHQGDAASATAVTTSVPVPDRRPERVAGTPLLTFGTTTLDLGSAVASASIELVNDGDGPADWELVESGGLVVHPTTGQLQPGETVALSISVDASTTGEGDHLRAVVVAAGSSQARVAVAFGVEVPPVVDVLGGPGPRECPDAIDATVSVDVSDDSGVDSVFLSWRSPSGRSGRMAMVLREGHWYASLPVGVEEPGSWAWEVVATDDRGNAGSAGNQFSIGTCAGPAGPTHHSG